jgi:hypothetical protein
VSEYKLVLDGLATFVVDITSTGGHQSMRRFSTEAEALMWIAEQEFLDAAGESVKEVSGNQSSLSRSSPDPVREADQQSRPSRLSHKGEGWWKPHC